MTTTPGTRLEGLLVRLRAKTEVDLPHLVRWYSDPAVRHWLHSSEAPLPTIESERARMANDEGNPAVVNWLIETLNGKPIGLVGIRVDEMHGRGELGVSIGDKAYWGRGYGTDAIRLALRFAFENLGLRRVELITDVDNARGIRCYEKCGFVREGVLRGKRLRYGEPLDMVVMGALRDEWLVVSGERIALWR